MAYKCEKETRERASAFVIDLNNAGYDFSVRPDTVRDYVIKIDCLSDGMLRIYYKPSKRIYTLDFTEYRGADKDSINDLWNGSPREDHAIKKMPADESGYVAYADGSYSDGVVSYGAVILFQGKKVHEMCGRVHAAGAEKHRQIGGEIEGVKKVIEWCSENSVEQISIFYDYIGLEKWGIGAWKTNTPITKEYSEFMKKAKVRVFWKKVKSHSGDEWNDYADMLAKKGLSQK